THFVPSLKREISPVWDLIALIKLYQLLRRLKPDIVHTHSSKAGILGRWAAFLARTPVIIHTFHGFGFNDFQKPAKKALLVLSERITALVTTALIAVSHHTKQTGLKHRIGREAQYTVINSGIHRNNAKSVDRLEVRKKLGFKSEDILITNISCLKPQKNVSDFVRVAKELVKKNPEKKLQFVVIGDGEERGIIQTMTAELQVSERVHLLGWRRDTAEILSASDIFVLTSLWEGLPRALLEAMDAGLPCCVYRVDGIHDIMLDGKNEFSVEAGNVIGLTEILNHMVNDSSFRKYAGSECKKSMKKDYYIDIMVDKINVFYSGNLS
ncbi:MAG: glycosyltransferase, partial [Chitinivibrionales bacterium]|nr:glycosyltransferase [Chitinivibrionales bacterium]